MTYLSIDEAAIGAEERLPEFEGWPVSVHAFGKREVLAINTALASGRPLLVRGEPGTGKTQLARAAAVRLRRHFVSETLDAHTEARDLFWTIDAVRRLSEAQVQAAAFARSSRDDDGESKKDDTLNAWLSERLAEDKFVEPGAMWWAFDWPGAAEQENKATLGPRRTRAEWVPKDDAGAVVLLDEIDKADPVLPNALLEVLGTGRFQGPMRKQAVEKSGPEPLIVITTNEERELPAAFVRRCAVLHLALPTTDASLRRLLMERGRQHAEAARADPMPSDAVLEKAADRLITERKDQIGASLSPAGQAEYLDLIRAVCKLGSTNQERVGLIDELQFFLLDKHGRRFTPDS